MTIPSRMAALQAEALASRRHTGSPGRRLSWQCPWAIVDIHGPFSPHNPHIAPGWSGTIPQSVNSQLSHCDSS